MASAIEQCLPKQVDHLVVEAEVEASPNHVGGSIFEHAAQVADRLVETALLAVDDAAQPGPGPAWISFLVFVGSGSL